MVKLSRKLETIQMIRSLLLVSENLFLFRVKSENEKNEKNQLNILPIINHALWADSKLSSTFSLQERPKWSETWKLMYIVHSRRQLKGERALYVSLFAVYLQMSTVAKLHWYVCQ